MYILDYVTWGEWARVIEFSQFDDKFLASELFLFYSETPTAYSLLENFKFISKLQAIWKIEYPTYLERKKIIELIQKQPDTYYMTNSTVSQTAQNPNAEIRTLFNIIETPAVQTAGQSGSIVQAYELLDKSDISKIKREFFNKFNVLNAKICMGGY